MEIIVIIISALAIVLPTAILVIGILREKKKRIIERNKMFCDDTAELTGNLIDEKPSIDAVSVITKILSKEIKKAVKAERKTTKSVEEQGSSVNPSGEIKPKTRKSRKPKNKNKNDGDQMLLS